VDSKIMQEQTSVFDFFACNCIVLGFKYNKFIHLNKWVNDYFFAGLFIHGAGF
jgi:hypothetical protein